MSFNTRIFAIKCFKDIVNKSLGRNGIIPDAVKRVYDKIRTAVQEITGSADDKSKQERLETNGMANNNHEKQDEER